MDVFDYDKLMHDYGKELMTKIDLAFRSYELDFHWISSFIDDNDPINIYDSGVAEFTILGYNKYIQPDIEDDDFIAFKALVTEVVNNFMAEYSQKPPYDLLKLTVEDLEVFEDTLHAFYWDSDTDNNNEFVEAITIDMYFRFKNN